MRKKFDEDERFNQIARKKRLHFEAEKAGVNFSAILTVALKRELKIQSR